VTSWRTYLSRAALTGVSFVIAAGLASPALAGNTMHKRTPVLWPEAPCIQEVTLEPGAEFVFDYDIPFEDTMLSVDELDDSRRHQFVAFCRQWPGDQRPPNYISVADLERSIDAGLEQPDRLDDPEATLETSAAWAGCWTRITADADRRPITEAAAAAPVVWSLDGVAPGTWVVAGYTWEPNINLWRRAPWVVRVVEEPAQAPVEPAATLDALPEGIYPGDTLPISGCVEAVLGSSARLEWSFAEDPPAWTSVAELELDDAPALAFEFSPPEGTLGQTLFIRALVESPVSGPSYAAHAPGQMYIYTGGDGDGDGPETGDGDGDGSETGDGETGEPPSGTESGTGSPGAEPQTGSSGGCRLSPGSPRPLGPAGAILWLLLLARRRSIARRPPSLELT